MSEQRATFVVDRIEGKMAVLVADADERQIDVPRTALPKDARREGTVLRVQLDKTGQLDWSTAEVDRAEEQRRLEEARQRLDKLKASDPGGDISL